MYVDLDHFKRLNDCCGHDVGDEALVQTAALLRKTVRPADVVARLGGDEFALWLDGSDELTAAERAERLRLDAPEVLAACLPPSAPALSTSIGIASRDPHMAETLEAIMRRADSAMYEVKRAGRGQWRVAPNPPRP
jgi:diguanylate cyclase (GGDEF)-like protein